MPKTFISYASEDSDCAAATARGLEAAGCPTWYYERDSVPGSPYVQGIIDALDSASSFVLIVSRDSMQSRQVDLEVFRAFKSGKQIFPVLVGVSFADFETMSPTWTTMLRDTTPLAAKPGEWDTIAPRLLPSLMALAADPLGDDRATEDHSRPQRGRDTRAGVYLSWDEAAVGCVKCVTTDRGAVEVSVPPGTADGAEIRQAGQGKAGTGGGPAGDLVVSVSVALRPIRGDDIQVALSIGWDEAASGCVKSVSVDGRFLDISIPPGTRNGAEVRRRGVGGIGSHGGPTGDLVAQVIVQPPPIRGHDIRASLSVGWDEAWVGCQKSVTVGDRTVDLSIPQGTENGAEIRVSGMGEPGREGGPAGDLIVRIAVPPPPVRGDDIVMPVTLAWTEARLGCVKQVIADDKPYNIRFGPGTRDGADVVKPGKGKPGSLGGPPGDLILRVTVGPHPERGSDISTAVIIRWDQAQSGCVKRLTVDGVEHAVRIPPRTADGSEVHVPGKGRPGTNGGPPGNLVVRANVVKPPPALVSPKKLILTVVCLTVVLVAGAYIVGSGRWTQAGTVLGKRGASAAASRSAGPRAERPLPKRAGANQDSIHGPGSKSAPPAPQPPPPPADRAGGGTLVVTGEGFETTCDIVVAGSVQNWLGRIRSHGRAQFSLPPGQYQVSGTASDGNGFFEESVTVIAGKRATLRPTLSGTVGSIKVNLKPPYVGAVQLSIDEQSTRQVVSGDILDRIPVGLHRITATKGSLFGSNSVSVKRGQVTPADIPLEQQGDGSEEAPQQPPG